jgi:hypothetical protein
MTKFSNFLEKLGLMLRSSGFDIEFMKRIRATAGGFGQIMDGSGSLVSTISLKQPGTRSENDRKRSIILVLIIFAILAPSPKKVFLISQI